MEESLQLILSRLSNIEQLVGQPASATVNADPPLSTEEAAARLGISTSTLYKRIGDIPHRKQFGKLYFFGSELEDYLRKSPRA